MQVVDSSSMLHFQKLDVYQRSIEFLALARRVRQRLPKGHADLADQLRRAAQSIPQNIAEGCGRTTRADKAKHYTIARGSAMESASHFDVMRVVDRCRVVRAGYRAARTNRGDADKAHRSLIVQGVDQAPRYRSRVTSAATITGSITATATTRAREAVREPH